MEEFWCLDDRSLWLEQLRALNDSHFDRAKTPPHTDSGHFENWTKEYNPLSHDLVSEGVSAAGRSSEASSAKQANEQAVQAKDRTDVPSTYAPISKGLESLHARKCGSVEMW